MVTVRVCVGTYCYLQGGQQLAQWKNYIPTSLMDKVTFVGSSCLGCKENNTKPPYVMIGEVVIEKATPEKVIEEIEKQLERV
ncbi:MAG: NAD(P)H-dependent oxidoreductase subunit E [Bacteroidales bacterium]